VGACCGAESKSEDTPAVVGAAGGVIVHLLVVVLLQGGVVGAREAREKKVLGVLWLGE